MSAIGTEEPIDLTQGWSASGVQLTILGKDRTAAVGSEDHSEPPLKGALYRRHRLICAGARQRTSG